MYPVLELSEAEHRGALFGGSGGNDIGRGLPAEMDGDAGAARAGGVLVHDYRIDMGAQIAQVSGPGIGELQGAIAMNKDGFTVMDQTQSFIDIHNEGGPGRSLALTFKGLAAAAMIAT